MTAAHFEDHPTDPDKVILRKPPRIDQGPDYERGFIDGMQHQMQSSVDKAVNRMAQPEQEPRAWINWSALTGEPRLGWECESELASEPLYTTPPQRKPLTDDEIGDISKNYALSNPTTPLYFARAIEAAHGIKGLV